MSTGDRPIIGLEETITCYGVEKKKKLKVRVDTGASKSSIDVALAQKLGVGPVIKERTIRNAHGSEVRKVIKLEIELAGKQLSGMFTLADRKIMKYPILIGRNILKKGNFLIDPKK